MRKLFLTLATIPILATPAMAQDESRREGVSTVGTVFASPGSAFGEAALLNFGGGGEFVWPNGLGVGVDGGYITAFEDFSQGATLLTAGPLYEFGRTPRYRPYVRGGLSFAIAQGFRATRPLMHVGGGINHWVSQRWGLKYGIRSHFHPRYPRSQVVEFSIGLLFRR